MANSVEAAYRNRRDQEMFRETMPCDHLGVPTAVRHRDGLVYVLVLEADGTALYREDLDQRRWNGGRDKGPGDGAPGLEIAASSPGVLAPSRTAVVRTPPVKAISNPGVSNAALRRPRHR